MFLVEKIGTFQVDLKNPFKINCEMTGFKTTTASF